jgi:hypothetical protein
MGIFYLYKGTIPGETQGGEDEKLGKAEDISSINSFSRPTPNIYSRSARRQELASRLYACGPRPVLEALLEVERGRALDDVLIDFTRIASSVYRAVGADRFPIHYPLGVIRGGRR